MTNLENRCAIHFHSNKVTNEGPSAYSALQEASIYKSEGFSSILSISQEEGREVTAETAKGKVHLRDENNNLEIFVPRNSRDRRVCYGNQLPTELVCYFGIDDPEAVGLFKTVFGNDLDILEDLLEEHGVGQLDTEQYRDAVVDLEEGQRDETNWGEEDDDETIVDVTMASRTSSGASIHPISAPSADADVVSTPESVSGSRLSTPQRVRDTSPSSHRPSLSPPSEDFVQASRSAYTALLDDVVNTARHMSFPVLGLSQSGGLPSRPQINTSSLPFGDRSLNRNEHDKLIGAAGELFVSLGS